MNAEVVRPLDLDSLTLLRGSHHAGNYEFCVMEAVAYMAGEKHSDSPKCASPVISAFMRQWNDDLDDAGRQKLKPYIPKLIGTKASKAVEEKRAWMVTDWLVRVYTPAWLDLGKMPEQAAALRALPALESAARAKAAQGTINEARDKAAAARAAAWDAARAAARDAAGDAAGAAARDAAWAAAGDAARDAAWAAAGDAARDAAWAAARAAAWAAARAAAWAAAWAAARAAAWAAAERRLQPTVVSLQASAFDLLDRLIEA